jgi:hypothetical protein
MPMTPYPSEWMLDVYSESKRFRQRPYVFDVPTPPIPWPLVYGWRIIGATLVVGSIAIYFVR